MKHQTEISDDSFCLQESFWTFTVPEQGISVPFVVAGDISEPRVTFSKPSINFKQVMLGRKGHEKVELINSENIPFTFALDKATYDATDDIVKATGPPAVLFQPSSGTVPPNSSIQINAVFMPTSEKVINYTIVCNVRKKPTRLTLNVKGEGYAIHESVCMDIPGASEITLTGKV